MNSTIINNILLLKNYAIQVSVNLHDLLSGEAGGFSPAFASIITANIEVPSFNGGMIININPPAVKTELDLLSFTPILSSQGVELYKKLKQYDPSIMTTDKYTKLLKEEDFSRYDGKLLIQVVRAKMIKTDSSLWDSLNGIIVDPNLLNEIRIICIEAGALLLAVDDYIVNPELNGIPYSINDIKIILNNIAYVSEVIENIDLVITYDVLAELRKLQYNLETIIHKEFYNLKQGGEIA